jgi:Ni2+-binding GTPase involved in maturation of urease and hydrogenase
MEKDLLCIPQMILIGSSGRNSGKTTLAAQLINQLENKSSIIGLKITTIEQKNGKCPRGGDGCGTCSNLKGNFELLEETNKNSKKDTSILLKAGAEKVYWLKCLKTDIGSAINNFMSRIPENTLIICESNSLRNVVNPGIFIMINNTNNNIIKKSASEVIDKADIIIENDFKDNIDVMAEKILKKLLQLQKF